MRGGPGCDAQGPTVEVRGGQGARARRQALISKLQGAAGAHKPNGYEFDAGRVIEAAAWPGAAFATEFWRRRCIGA